MIFRLMFTFAFLILGSDGVRGHHRVNESMFWTDFLVMVGAFGCCVSSALTIVVRFQPLPSIVYRLHPKPSRFSSPDPLSQNT